MKATIFHFLIILVFSSSLLSRNVNLDSLLKDSNTHDTVKIDAITNHGIQIYRESMDSALFYFFWSLEEVNKAIERKHFSNEEVNTLLLQKAISLRSIGNIYNFKGVWDKAIEYFYLSLEISEKLNDKKGISACYNNIGMVNSNIGDYDNALIHHEKSKSIKEEIGDKRGVANSLNNIGLIHRMNKAYDSALKCYEESMAVYQEIGDISGLSACYNNIAIIHTIQGNYETAIEYYLKSNVLKEQIGDKKGIALVYGNIAISYVNIADSIAKSKSEKEYYYKTAIEYGIKANNIAKDIKATPTENTSAHTLMATYSKLGSFKKAMEYAEIYINTKEIMFSEEKTKILADMQAKFETEKRQKEIEKQILQIEKQRVDFEQQRLINNFMYVGAALFAILALVVIIAYLHKQKSNEIISNKSHMLEQAFEEIFQQKEELQVQSFELGKINTSLENRIIEELAKSRKKDFLLIQKSRQAAMGEMIANIAHQWRQPLNAVGIIVQNLQDAYEYNELTKEYIDNKVKQSMALIQHMSETINAFRDFFKPERVASTFNVKQIVKNSISFVEDSLKKCNIELEASLESDVFAFGYANEYAQVVLNLLNNSKDAIADSKVPNPKIQLTLSKKNNKSYLTVTDNGGGIGPKNIDKIFDPYFSTKSSDEGTGLGLYMSKTIIEKHDGGSISFENTEDGARFIVVL